MQDAEAESPQVHNTCAIEVSPKEVDAGADLSLLGKATLSPPLDLRGDLLLIEDQDGNEIGSLEFTEFDDKTFLNQTAALVLKAPVAVGEVTWTAVLPAYEDEEDADLDLEEIRTPFTFTVRAHKTRLVVWDVPSAIVAGERFKLKVGLKCSSECQLSGTGIAIVDHEGNPAGKAAVGADHWPGGSLHYAEFELTAPSEPGPHKWEARVEGSEKGLAHAGAAAPFTVTSVAEPDFTVKVTALDAEQKTPLKNVRVVIHPYRVMTNDEGVAELRLPKGGYKMFLSATRYEPTDTMIEVNADVVTTAELFKEPPEDLAAPYKT